MYLAEIALERRLRALGAQRRLLTVSPRAEFMSVDGVGCALCVRVMG